MWLARIYVTLKPVVNDPQGIAIQGGLRHLGFTTVTQVRAGKFLEVRLEAPTEAEASTQVESMCRTLLANPVIEDFRYELSEAAAIADEASSR
jgi:phosphoribosylformylglycinamidine synthase